MRVFARSKLYFYNIYVKVTCFTLVIVLVLSFFLYSSFKNYSIDIINQSNEMLLTQISNTLIQLNESAKKMATSLFNQPSAANLMYSDNIEIVDLLSSINSINRSLVDIPYIHSVYFYNGKKETYYSLGPNPIIRSKKDFFDKEIVNAIETVRGPKVISPFPRKLVLPDMEPEKNEEVYTYIMTELFFDETRKVKNALVFNIKLDWIFNTIASKDESIIKTRIHNNIMLVDAEGVLINHPNKDMYMKNVSDQPHIKRIYASNENSGFFIGDVSGEKSVITYVSISSPKWKLISITPYSYIAESVNKVKYITFAIALTVLLFGFITAFLLSRRLYLPIGSLRNRIMQISGKNTILSNQSNEFDLIASQFISATEKLTSLECFKNNNFALIKQELLRNILFNKIDYKEIYQKLEELNIQLSRFSTIFIVLLKVDNYSTFCSEYNEADQSLYKFALSNITIEILSQYFKGEAVDAGNSHVVAILNSDGYDEINDCFYKTLNTAIKDIQEIYFKYYSISISAFVSELTDNINKVPKLYKDILDFSNYRIIYGHSCVLFHSQLEDASKGKLDIADSNLSNLIDSLKAAKQDEVFKSLEKVISSLYCCNYNNIMFILSYLLSCIFNTLSIIEKNSVISFDLDFVSFNKKIESLETLEQVRNEFHSLFKQIFDKISESKDHKSDIVVDNVIKNIESNYMNKNLSPDIIADEIGLASAYLGRIFRENISKSISDYITEVRMIKAKELLYSGNYTIEEITDKVGWENKKYFYTIFKKTFGVTPTEYRLKSRVNYTNSR